MAPGFRSSPVPVLFVHHRPERSGAAIALARLVEQLDRQRFEPHVLTPAGTAATVLARAGATVHTAPASGFTHVWASSYRGARWALLGRELARLPAHLSALRRLLGEGRFPLVHLNDSPLVPAAWLARRSRAAVVWHLRAALPPPGRDRRSRALRRAVTGLADAAVAINEDVAASFGVPAAVVHDPVDITAFRPPAAEERAPAHGRPLTVGSFGYLYPAKGFRELLAAARTLHERGVDAVWLVAGGGVRGADFFGRPAVRLLERAGAVADHAGEAARLVRELGLEERVRLLPYAADVAPLYRACDVVVLPSRGPELGLPALEAAASGVPAVATGSSTGAGVLVPGETGLLAPGGGPAEIALAVERLARDPDLRRRLGAAARRLAEERFDARLVARRIEEIYADVLARRGRPADPGA